MDAARQASAARERQLGEVIGVAQHDRVGDRFGHRATMGGQRRPDSGEQCQHRRSDLHRYVTRAELAELRAEVAALRWQVANERFDRLDSQRRRDLYLFTGFQLTAFAAVVFVLA